jgi:hypothetical protein
VNDHERPDIALASYSKSVKDASFTLLWAALTVFLLPRFGKWLAWASFGVLALTTLLDGLRVLLLLVGLPRQRKLAANPTGLTAAVMLQVAESALSTVICLWMFRALR